MALNPALYTTLKTAINAETDPTFVSYRTAGQTPLMVAWLNAEHPSNTKVWNSNVDPRVTDEATPWVNFDAIAQAGKRESWVHAFMRYNRDYTKAAVRKWVTDVWGNAVNPSDAYTILTEAGMRNGTRAELILGGNTQANRNDATAIKLTWEGSLTDADVSNALSQG